MPARPPVAPGPVATPSGIAGSLAWIAGGSLATAIALQSMLSLPEAFATMGSRSLRERLVTAFGGTVPAALDAPIDPPSLLSLWLVVAVAGLAITAFAALWGRNAEVGRQGAFSSMGRHAGRWMLLPGLWEVLRLTAFVTGWTSLEGLLIETGHLFLAGGIAGCLASLASGEANGPGRECDSIGTRRSFVIVVAGACTYAVVFTAMNWQLYRSLLVPHGDTVMYEEHLWNLLHGKGFRSYLDQGLFLGEHLQVIHALLIPVYVLWPSHLLLELCGSIALASGALPTYWLARRHTGSPSAAMWMGLAYLLAVPMQFLDIAIDLKTFRPTSFVIPLMLFALDQMERRRWKTMLVLLAVTLLAQEDLSLVIGPLGVWMAWDAWRRGRQKDIANPQASDRTPVWIGGGVALFAGIYLIVALTVLIPWFRAGAEVHYTTYFGELGASPGEIARSMLTKPGLFFGKLLGIRSLKYVLLLLLPYGLMPLRSPGRLAIAGPLFAALCLMDTSRDPAQQGLEMLLPYHHFHAPLVPILVWAATAGIGASRKPWKQESGQSLEKTSPVTSSTLSLAPPADLAAGFERRASWRARFVFGSAVATGLFLGLSPLGIAFWDAGSTWHWRRLYVPGKRSEMLPRVLAEIPPSSRVASTDFVHPRFTHYERSYDYSAFRRRVSGYELRVPDDTDYIVIDTQHRYSTIKSPKDIRELREEPDEWELLPDTTEGYFIVLRRKTRSE